MARAGFTAIGAGQISFGKDGRWYCDGEPIANRAICRLYARAMTVGPDGSARLELGPDRASVRVEDTPWVVVGVQGDPAHGFTVRLNDERKAALDLDTLEVGAEHVLYCRVDGQRLRFLRPAYYELMQHAEPGPAGGCRLRAGGRQVLLGRGR